MKWDRDNLNAKQQEKESVFIDKLSNPGKAARLTLADLILVLQKCLSSSGSKTGNGSKLRTEAARFLNEGRQQFESLLKAKWLHQVHLTTENVNWFRNRASHDDPLGLVDAAVGRFLAKRVLDVFFQPALDKWGFTPVIAPDGN